MMILHAKQARWLLFGLISVSTVSLGAMLLHPMPIQPPSRQSFTDSEQLFRGARNMEAISRESISTEQESNREIARGEAKHWRVTLRDGRELMLTELPLRVRSFNNFELQRMKQLFSLGKSEKKRLGSAKHGAYLVGSDSILVSRINEGLRAETCITPDSIGNISQNQLINSIRHIPLTGEQRLASIFGVRQPREWQCLYVAATLPSSTGSVTEATTAWRSLRQRAGN